jgi:hypothetical protein
MEQHGEAPDDVATRLAALDDLPVDQHVSVYNELHRELRDQLVDGPAEEAVIDEGAPRPRP